MINPFYLSITERETAILKIGGLKADEAQAAVSKLNEVSESDKSHHYIQGVRDMADELKQLCKDFSDLQNRPYMKDVYSAVDGLRDQMIGSVPAKPVPPQAPPKTPEEIAIDRELAIKAFKDL